MLTSSHGPLPTTTARLQHLKFVRDFVLAGMRGGSVWMTGESLYRLAKTVDVSDSLPMMSLVWQHEDVIAKFPEDRARNPQNVMFALRTRCDEPPSYRQTIVDAQRQEMLAMLECAGWAGVAADDVEKTYLSCRQHQSASEQPMLLEIFSLAMCADVEFDCGTQRLFHKSVARCLYPALTITRQLMREVALVGQDKLARATREKLAAESAAVATYIADVNAALRECLKTDAAVLTTNTVKIAFEGGASLVSVLPVQDSNQTHALATMLLSTCNKDDEEGPSVPPADSAGQ